MGAPSTYVQLLNAQKVIKQLQTDLYYSKGFDIQQCMDMAMIALHEEFGFGPKYNARFEAAFRRVFVEYADICVDDAADDRELTYTKTKVDRALAAACGDILPFDERYIPERMYFRESREQWERGEIRDDKG